MTRRIEKKLLRALGRLKNWKSRKGLNLSKKVCYKEETEIR
jgi:hypothetical protein